MGRPTDRDEARSQTINIRVTPALKAKLETRAKLAGRRLSSECETRLLQSMDETESNATEETRKLLARIQQLIGEIELWTGKKWHKSIGTWAAVAEMLAHGPIMERPPEAIQEKEQRLQKPWDELVSLLAEQDAITDRLKFIGVSEASALGGKLLKERSGLREHIDRLGLNDTIRERAQAEVARLEEIDRRTDILSDSIAEIVELFASDAEEGGKVYERPMASNLLRLVLQRLEMRREAAKARPLSEMFGSRGRPFLMPNFAEQMAVLDKWWRSAAIPTPAPLGAPTSEGDNNSAPAVEDAR